MEAISTTRISYKKMDAADKAQVRKICHTRWLAVRKRLAITLILPILCIIGISVIINVFRIDLGGNVDRSGMIIFPIAAKDFILLLFITIPIFLIIIITNGWLFMVTIPIIYYERIRGIKKCFVFQPRQYMIDNVPGYYMQTGIPDHPFFEVNFDTYCNIENTPSLVMEITPKTKILLGIKTTSENSIVYI